MSENIGNFNQLLENAGGINGQENNIPLTTKPSTDVVETQKKEESAPSIPKRTTKERNMALYDGMAKSAKESEALEAGILERAFDLRHRMARVYGSEGEGYVYAAFIQEQATKEGNLLLLVEYPDGTLSKPINVPQDGLFDKSNYFTIHEAGSPIWLKNAKCLEVLRKFCEGDMDIDYVTLYCTLRKHYKELPVGKIQEKYTLPEAYKLIVRVAESLRDINDVNHEDFIPFDCEDYVLNTKAFERVAYEAGYKPRELLKLLAVHDILRADEGEKLRYQKSKRIPGAKDPKRFYVFKHETEIKAMVREQQDMQIKVIPSEQRPDVCTYKKSYPANPFKNRSNKKR
ncbi:hypothetical protein [Candidatus Formimonas warabiya]|uniref:Uncharacterized protein n=1 Tax=Formimonas warabiya TaxID=1761012 RepID=A0A3G1KT67_FORW1|nr:hypothetical protein [Candidatus Formimonas warabiya]ATW25620.1 hypothetical protein DCMF_13385 [Candidatus Formimonas warabiya]